MHPNSSNSDKIRFDRILSDLIVASQYRRNRQEICQILNISPTSLSQYVNGKSIPRLDVLVDIAALFEVSLDYLVLGKDLTKPPISEETRSMQRYLDWALADVQAKVAQRSWATMQVGRVLGQQIETAVSTAMQSAEYRVPMLTTDEQLILEQYAKKVYMFTPHLSYDIISISDDEVTAGRFGRVVGSNLASDPAVEYRILVPSDLAADLAKSVSSFQQLLVGELRVPRDRLNDWEVRSTETPLLIGSCFYQLDLDRLKREEPTLALMLSDFVTPENWISYSIHDTTDEITRGEVLVSRQNVLRAVGIFEGMWKSSERMT